MIETQIKTTIEIPSGLSLSGKMEPYQEEILAGEALNFIMNLHRRFNAKRKFLLEKRQDRQRAFDAGVWPDFLPETKMIRETEWKVEPVPPDIQDRRVEITGPVNRKMVINALNSGAKVFMADFEDSHSPTWKNCMEGQVNLKDAVRKTIEYVNPSDGKVYRLNDETAVLFVRPRGWHLEEKHVLVDDEPVSASLFDFGLYFFHNAHALLASGTGPYFYLPKLESHLEARLWDEVFIYAQDYFGIPYGTIKATVLIETLPAVFELDEILYELRQHSAGLNCGRWDYIFSYIKKFRNHPNRILPNRDQVSMTVPMMQAYTDLVIRTCHIRGAHAMGGMAAQIPVRDDKEANVAAIGKVRLDKQREVLDGHDGTWVAHPGLVPVAMEVFDRHMKTPNQLSNLRKDVVASAPGLIRVPTGTITEEGMRVNINVGILYLESWLRGVGAAALYNLMEDAATAEICRTQLWQWVHYPSYLSNGVKVTETLYDRLRDEELEKIEKMKGTAEFNRGKFKEAVEVFDALVKGDQFTEFLTIPAYQLID